MKPALVCAALVASAILPASCTGPDNGAKPTDWEHLNYEKLYKEKKQAPKPKADEGEEI